MVKFLGIFCLLGTVFSAPSITDSLIQARSDYQTQQKQQPKNDQSVTTIKTQTQNIQINQPQYLTNQIIYTADQKPLTIQQQILLPQKQCFSGVLRDNYNFKILNDVLPSLPFTLVDNGFVFSGCNQNKIQLQVNSDGTLQYIGKSSSNQKKCQIDNDQDYIDAITFADGYGIDGGNFYLTRKGYRYIDFIKNFDNKYQLSDSQIIIGVRPTNIRKQLPSLPSIPVCNPSDAQENFSFHGQVNTKFGVVKIIKSQGMTLPRGWRRLSWQEGQQIQSQLFSILQQWSIVEFGLGEGYLVGSGYGSHYEIGKSNIGEYFIRKIC